MKKVFRILVWVIIALIVALLLAPFIFRDQLQESIKEEINKTINAEVDFSDASISLFKEFPRLSVELSDMVVTGKNHFKGQHLFQAKNIYLGTDLISLIKSDEGVNIRSISIDQPIVDIIIDQVGRANYDILKKDTDAETDSSTMFGEIEEYKVTNGQVNYTDRQGRVLASLDRFDHSGSGNFQNISFDLDTKTTIGSIDFSSDGIKYLNNAKLNSDLVLSIDLDNQQYTFRENLTRLNDLDLTFTGDITQKDQGFNIALDVTAPNNKVSSILSLIPSAYNEDFAGITSTGNSYLSGEIKGRYDAIKNLYPKFKLKVNIEDGSIKYPDFVLPVTDIDLAMYINNNTTDLSDLTIDIEEFRFLINEDRMVGKMKITNALTKPEVAGLIDGTLNLEHLSQALPLEGIALRSGIIKSKLNLEAKADDVMNKNYKAVKFEGEIESKDLDLSYNSYPFKSETMQFKLKPESIETKYTNTYIGKSDFNGTALITNPLAFITDETEAETTINAKSKVLDIDELNSFSQHEHIESESDSLEDLSLYKEFNVTANYQATEVKYDNYQVTDLEIQGQYHNNKIKIVNSSALLDRQAINLRGEADEVIDYVFANEKLKGKFFFDAKQIDANKYLTDEGTDSGEISEPFIVPHNLDISIYPEIETLIYDDYKLTRAAARLDIKDGIAALSNGSANTLGGQINIEGLYDSNNPTKPLFDLKYDMSEVDFSSIAKASKSFKILAPIISYIQGAFNSTIVMAGTLDKDMMPDLTQLSASGFLETLEGEIRGFEPLRKLGDALGIEKLNDWNLKGTKNWFEVKDGKVILKPHDHKFDDMIFTLGGSHSLAQELDYTIKALIPREKLSKDKLGKKLEFGMDYLEKEAASRGVKIDLGEMIYLDIFVTGTIKKPQFKVVPVGSGGKTLNEVVKDEVNKQVDIIKDTLAQEIEKRTDALKDTVTKVVDAQVDTIKNQIKEKVKSETDKQKDKLKDLLKDKVDSSASKVLTDTLQTTIEKKAEEILGGQAKGGIDSLKSKILDWNPLKKKKN